MIISISVSLDCNPVGFEGRSVIDFGTKRLSDKESDIFNRYFVNRNTLKEIGVVYGVDTTRIHRIVKRIRLKVMKRIGRETD